VIFILFLNMFADEIFRFKTNKNPDENPDLPLDFINLNPQTKSLRLLSNVRDFLKINLGL
jgi:hypothetical protein